MSRADGRCAFCGADLEDCHCNARRAPGRSTQRKVDTIFRRESAPTPERMRAYALECAMEHPEVVAMLAAREEAAAEYEAAVGRLEADAAAERARLEAVAGPAVAALAMRLTTEGRSRAEVALMLAAAMQPAAEVAAPREVADAQALPSRRSRKLRTPMLAVLGAALGRAALGAVLAVAALIGAVVGLAEFAAGRAAAWLRAQIGGYGRHGRRGAVAAAVRWVYLALTEPAGDARTVTDGRWGWAA